MFIVRKRSDLNATTPGIFGLLACLRLVVEGLSRIACVLW